MGGIDQGRRWQPLRQRGRRWRFQFWHRVQDQALIFLRGVNDPKSASSSAAQKDASVVRHSVLQGNEQLFASKYRLVLPSEEELRAELDREQRLLLGDDKP
jgi:hypothetical protein